MKSAKLSAPEIEHLFAAGWAALQGGRVSEAEEAFLGVLASDQKHVDALNGLGTAYFHENRLEESGAMHEKALASALAFYGGEMPDHVEWTAPHDRGLLRALHGLALVAYRGGRLKDAERRFNQLLKLNPGDNTGARFLLADLKKGRTRWEGGASA